jgi:amino-acid N-acetyltransferase
VVVQDTVRRATADDQTAIIRLVREARLNPRSLRWERFVVGAAQVRRHPDGSRELASLVVRRQDRGHGVAGAMIDTLLADEPGPVFTVVDRRYAEHFRSWDFDPVDPARLPPSMRTQLRIGRVVTGVGSLLLRRRIRLQPLRRPPATRTDDPPPCGHSAAPCTTNP